MGFSKPHPRSRHTRAPSKDGGVYLLVMVLRRSTTIRVGKLGTFRFPQGYYIYVGSAMRALSKRLSRHLRRRKKAFWHIDYFLAKASIIATKKYLTSKQVECFLNALFLRKRSGSIIAKKFGASDCSCPTHLWFFRFDPRKLLYSISSAMKEETE
jgi:sugar fermentation stimulation protein A